MCPLTECQVPGQPQGALPEQARASTASPPPRGAMPGTGTYPGGAPGPMLRLWRLRPSQPTSRELRGAPALLEERKVYSGVYASTLVLPFRVWRRLWRRTWAMACGPTWE